MIELPRSRTLVRLDGPGHIMPVEPVTPPDSTAWRVLHLPVMLGIAAAGLLVAAVLGMRLLGVGLHLFAHLPKARYLAPVIGAAAVMAVYWVFVRVVERRPRLDELGAGGWLAELGWGYCAGLAASLTTVATLGLLGTAHLVGVDAPRTLLLPFVDQFCTALVVATLADGVLFRLVERPLGSWLTLLVTAAAFAAVPLLGADAPSSAAVLAVIEVGLVCAAAYMATRRLWAAIGLYAAWNFAQIGLFGVGSSAGAPHGFVALRMAGPDWLTGGGAGADASAPAILVNALLAAALMAVAVRRGRIVRPAWRRGRPA